MQTAFTTRYNGRARVLKTKVGICLPHSNPEEAKQNNIEVKEYVATWDTGATNSVITKKVVDDLGLKPISVIEMHHAGGKSIANVYLVNIGLPNNVMMTNLRVSEASLTEGDGVPANEHSQVLIGMDVIGVGDFAVTNYEGKTTMSFCMPSSQELDFVPTSTEHNVMGSGNRHQRRAFQAQKRKGLI